MRRNKKYFNPSIPKHEVEWLVLYAVGRPLWSKARPRGREPEALGSQKRSKLSFALQQQQKRVVHEKFTAPGGRTWWGHLVAATPHQHNLLRPGDEDAW